MEIKLNYGGIMGCPFEIFPWLFDSVDFASEADGIGCQPTDPVSFAGAGICLLLDIRSL